MSVVTVQIGQAGNQVGCEFFDALSQAASPADVAAFFRQGSPGRSSKRRMESVSDGQHGASASAAAASGSQPTLEARAVLVDLEEKVIASTLQRAKQSGRWTYPKGQQYCQQRGAGNNWANGYVTCGEEESDQVLRLIMREVEKCDNLVGFLILMSVAGGTGSGFGTRVTERLRDTFPKAFIINQIVWPFASGEVIVQNYNSVLSLAHLHQVSDAIIVLQNDELQSICTKMHHLKLIGFDHINKVIADHMASVFQRSFHCPDGTPGSMGQREGRLGDMVEHLCPHADYKLLSLRSIPQMPEGHREYTLYQWPGTMRNLRQMLIANSPCEEGINWRVKVPDARRSQPRSDNFNVSLATLLVLRGTELEQADVSGFADPALYTPWSPDPFCLLASSTPRAHEKSAALLSNCKSIGSALDLVVGKAWNMYTSKAFVHQYSRHGVDQDAFVDCFATVEQILSAYSSL